jgi:hypothetical protein
VPDATGQAGKGAALTAAPLGVLAPRERRGRPRRLPGFGRTLSAEILSPSGGLGYPVAPPIPGGQPPLTGKAYESDEAGHVEQLAPIYRSPVRAATDVTGAGTGGRAGLHEASKSSSRRA